MLWLLATIGLTEILIRGKIFSDFRKWFPLHCYQCIGFWSGYIVGLLIIDFTNFPSYLIKGFLYGFAGAFLVPFVQGVEQMIDSIGFPKTSERYDIKVTWKWANDSLEHTYKDYSTRELAEDHYWGFSKQLVVQNVKLLDSKGNVLMEHQND